MALGPIGAMSSESTFNREDKLMKMQCNI